MWGDDRPFAEAVAALAGCNPFLPDRVELERLALGSDFQPHGDTWHPGWEPTPSPNVANIQARLMQRLPTWMERLLRGDAATEKDRTLYRELVYHALYNDYADDLLRLAESSDPTTRVSRWHAFEVDLRTFLPPEIRVPEPVPAELLFAWFFQLRRAFHYVFGSIYGSSRAVADLRAQVWQSVFTHDMARYRSGLYERMRDHTTLITGPSGTGKELVAQAIASSQFVPFDPAVGAFTAAAPGPLLALNLSALSPTLIESELFGHRKGSFTGALQDRKGWLETCPRHGTVFLDEIGEVSEEVQVKLLRVLQHRTFQRLGDTRDLTFEGKLVAATNREPEEEMAAGRMRQDFYYRICGDQIRTPSLRQQLADSPEELDLLLRVVAGELVGGDGTVRLAAEVAAWIDAHLGRDYPWPGNFRELEQCARNVMIRGTYRPGRPSDAPRDLAERIEDLAFDADELLSLYATLAYHRTGSYVAAAEKLGLDRRTVRARIDADYLATLRDGSGETVPE